MKPYTFDDLVAALNSVQPYDWSKFLRARLDSTQPHAPLGGIENAGWKLVYDANRSEIWRDYEDDRRMVDLMYSIGVAVRDDGTIDDVAYGGPAQKAGVTPATRLIAVDNRQFTPTILREAVQRTKSNARGVELLIKNGEYYSTHHIDYQGGEEYPHLVRDVSKPDILSKIIAPLTTN
jgi:predicted metalloprotease with PDZ domain